MVAVKARSGDREDTGGSAQASKAAPAAWSQHRQRGQGGLGLAEPLCLLGQPWSRSQSQHRERGSGEPGAEVKRGSQPPVVGVWPDS